MKGNSLTLLALMILLIGLVLWITGARGKAVQFIEELKK